MTGSDTSQEQQTKSHSATSDLAGLSRLVPYLKRYRRIIFVGFVAVIVGAAVALSAGQGIRIMLDIVFTEGADSALLDWFLVGALGAIVVWGIANYFRGYCMERAAMRVRDDIRKDVFSNIMSLQPNFIEEQSSGQLQTRIIADTMELAAFLKQALPTIFGSILMLIGGVIAAFYVSTKLSLLVLVALPIVFCPFFVLGKPLQRRGAATQQATADAGRFAGEIFRSIKIVQAYNQENRESKRFAVHVGNVFHHVMRVVRMEMGVNSIITVFALSGISVLLWIGAKDIAAGAMTVGQFFAFAFYANLIITAAGGLVSTIASVNVAAGAINRLVHLMDVDERVGRALTPKVLNKPTRGQIELCDVCFYYPSRPTKPALDNVNLTVQSRSRMALVGRSGAGKSTLFDLLLRFHDPSSGRITIDGCDLRELSLAQLRAQIGIVPQNDTLASGTVAQNICYGNPEASDDEIIAAATRAYVHEFIETLPNGYETELGEVGVRLSGGQKQRISLARAILVDPPILLLDEATSALDAESEDQVQRALDEVAASRTTIVIAHRLSTVLKADTIVVLDEGAFIAQGTHQELLSSCSLYERIVKLQLAVPDASEQAFMAI